MEKFNIHMMRSAGWGAACERFISSEHSNPDVGCSTFPPNRDIADATVVLPPALLYSTLYHKYQILPFSAHDNLTCRIGYLLLMLRCCLLGCWAAGFVKLALYVFPQHAAIRTQDQAHRGSVNAV